jgi:hypothetical protein
VAACEDTADGFPPSVPTLSRSIGSAFIDIESSFNLNPGGSIPTIGRRDIALSAIAELICQ